MLPGRLLNPKFSAGSFAIPVFLGAAIGTLRHHQRGSMVRVGHHSLRRSPTRSSLNLRFVDQCQDTATRFVGSVPRYQLDWIVVSYSGAANWHWWGYRAGGREWAPFITSQWCPTRSHSAHWLDIRRCAILGAATGIARILPVVRAEATAHADARFGPPPPT